MWSPAETAGVIAPVGTEKNRMRPQMRSTISAPKQIPGIRANAMSSLDRPLIALRDGLGNSGGEVGCIGG